MKKILKHYEEKEKDILIVKNKEKKNVETKDTKKCKDTKVSKMELA